MTITSPASPPKPRRLSRRFTRWLIPALVFLLLAGATLAGWRWQNKLQSENREAAGNQESAAITSEIRDRLRLHAMFLRSVQAFANAGNIDDLHAWRRFAQELHLGGNLSGMFAFAYAPAVQTQFLNQFINTTRRQTDRKDFTVFPQTKTEIATPIVFISPDMPLQRKAIGFDLMSETYRREAIDMTTIRRDVAMTGPITLLHDQDKPRPGFILMQALYRNSMPLNNTEERRAAFNGLVVTGYRIDEFIASLTHGPNASLILEIFDDSIARPEADTAPYRIFSSNENFKPASDSKYFHHEIDFGGRNWILHFYPQYQTGSAAEIDTPLLILFSGLFGSCLITLLVFYLANHRQRAERYAYHLTTTLRESEAALRETDRVKQSVLDAATEVAIIATDTKGLITVFNRGAEKMLGYRANEMIGLQSPAIIHVAEEIQAYGEFLSQELGRNINGFDIFTTLPNMNGSERREWTYVHRDGHHLSVELTVTAEKNSQGQPSGYLGIAIDVTARKQADDELRQHRDHLQELVAERTIRLEAALNQARAASQAKSEFVANMSHELRTPMHAILSFSELGNERATTQAQEKLAQYFSRIQHSATRLLTLINELLDLSKVESGSMELDIETADALLVTQQAATHIESLLDKRNLSLEIISLTNETRLPIDTKRITQVILNLLSNAIKFSPEGGTIRVELVDSDLPAGRRASDPHTQSALAIHVIDFGLGIPDTELDSIFEKFVQSSLTKTGAGGTGLGLAISRAIIHQHRGTLQARNNPEGGACFTITLPLDSTTGS
jgi:PAS domain S-box-containing protein